MHDNPDRTAFFFKRRVEIFFELVLKPIFNIVDEWYRYEWQWRGSSHVHALIWTPEGRRFNFETLDFTDPALIERVTLYLDSLCTACNPDIDFPDDGPNPCRKR